MKRMFLCCALTACGVAMAAPGAFAPQLSGFDGDPLLGADGRLRVAPDGAGIIPLGPDRWYRSDWYRQADNGQAPRSQWFDDEGRLLHAFPGRIRYDERLEGSDALWRVEISDGQGTYLGTGLADAQGKVHFPPMREAGGWRVIAPDRMAWQGRDGGARIFSLDGREVLHIDAQEIWVGGPFADRTAYVICGDYEMAPCRVQDEKGAVLLSGDFDEARPAGDDGWWLRQLDTWARVDAAGTRVGRALYQGRALWPRYRSSIRFDSAADRPLEVHRHANGLDSDAPERGWLLDDGRFVALPTSATGMIVDYCPGRWLLRGEEANELIVDAQGKVVGQARSLGFNDHPAFPWRLRNAHGGAGAAILDCDGRVLFEQANVLDFRATDAGVLGTLAGEQSPRLWIGADLRPHLMPMGLHLQERYIAPPLLVLEDAEGNAHLYNMQQQKVVAASFGSVEELTGAHLIFLRDGSYGMMLADGREVLPPIYAQILPMTSERIWTRQYVGRDGDWKNEVTLFDGNQRVLARRRFESGGMGKVPAREGGDGVPGVLDLSLGSMTLDGMSYGLRQWRGRNGEVLASAIHCTTEQRGSEAGSGVLLGRDWRLDSNPTRPCQVPAAVMRAVQDSGIR
ncbi:hypothetical protein [Stenotrophomonas indicatrix]|uniref:hypothetical protein n=1 Tax=Stenotrophomonas indicatrix TaxID=2045451 RepID=UPI001F0BF434|nr:hypothetical protein [Stenotrophomonas indicatrix]